ncbi:hypothetical protein M2352_005092 [Azospirillum fermentarium]|uniref:hypothetical protein n=1 Tax=Azospirillum fermentarium TaxID=1233114 RepID=UPI002228040C|nr:hypothetical protein [Azospirillum fermentarium]MCW2249432.1 hypothetical protein [Azospirillum fermentarium]
MSHLSSYGDEGGWNVHDLLDLPDDSLVRLFIDHLPPPLLAELFRTILRAPADSAVTAAVTAALPPAPQAAGGRAADAPLPVVANPVAPFVLTPLRVASMTVEQVRAHAAAIAAAARAADGAPRRALLELSARFAAVAGQRVADRAAMFRERSGIGSVPLTPEDLDTAETLKRRVRHLMERTLAGDGDGFLLDAGGTWEPGDDGTCPRPAFGPFGTDMLGYQAEEGAPGFYLDPRILPDERRRLRDVILADLDGRIDHALRARRHQGGDSSPWPRVWAAEEIVAALSVPAGYRLSRTRRGVTVPL